MSQISDEKRPKCENNVGGIQSFRKDKEFFVIRYVTGEKARLYILNNHVFRFYMSPTGNFLEYPTPNEPEHESKIYIKRMADYDTKAFENAHLENRTTVFSVKTEKIQIFFDKGTGKINVKDKRTRIEVMKEVYPLAYSECESIQTLTQNDDEFYFGGGMQNGRFSHKGEVIEIVNTNDWEDGGVTSPCPFYWSSYGVGVLRNTWQPGLYDFSAEDITKTTHYSQDFDAFYFINQLPKDILKDYFELTGKPFLMPEYAFYEAHLNAFNRDYWVKVDKHTPGAILYEDGEYYKSYQPGEVEDQDGILESLNGEKDNYQFSARAMVDRYKRYDMPLGWFIPNDGYGSGYGQTDSLDGDISNLKEFADYARENGVEVALWTESNLYPKDPENPEKGERDLNKEVGVAGVVALKADVAWIGHGYSFGLSAIEDAASVFDKVTKNEVRPMTIMVDGWAGTQRCAGIWSGDQYGGEWEYIRFHIPTYVGSGLSGQPNIGSDMDGIFGGKDKKVNIRDYQWKTFSPIQLNMDGWGLTPKTPFSFDEEAIKINRAYLKLKSMFMPYNYTIAFESIQGFPMIRAMFLEYPKEIPAYTKDSQYQYLWGSNILVAPIYNDKEDCNENSIRNGVYLPDPKQVWIDFHTGEKYQGGRIFNNFITPIWKLPVFIRDGAIIPLTNPNNNHYEINRHKRIFCIYPNGETHFTLYEDDGKSTDYLDGKFAVTKITSNAPKSNKAGKVYITISQTEGGFKNMVKEKVTELQIMTMKVNEKKIKVAINGETIRMNKVIRKKEYEENIDVFYYDEQFVVNPYLVDVTEEPVYQKFLLIKIRKMDITCNTVHVKVTDWDNEDKVFGRNIELNDNMQPPNALKVVEEKMTSSSIALSWVTLDGTKTFEIERDGVLFSNLKDSCATFDDFKPSSEHRFRIRSFDNNKVSKWSDYVTGITTEDPLKYTVKGIEVKCNIPCQPSQEICKLTDGNCKSIWHTNWGKEGKAKQDQNINLFFDLRKTYDIEKIEYHPRDDAGNGTLLSVTWKTSVDKKIWSDPSTIEWKQDKDVKIIEVGNNFRYLELLVHNSVGDFGSGKQMLFYKKKETD